MIITRTPFRVSFFGGGTDYPAWYRNFGGSVLTTTIDKYCYISCRPLPPFFDFRHRIAYSKIETVKTIEEIAHPSVRAVMNTMEIKEGLEIHHDADLPARSGLGSSSSFTVGLVNALHAQRGEMISKWELARQAIHIEQNVIPENVGSQDQIAASYGGLMRIDFNQDETFKVSSFILRKERKQEFENHLMLFFTGFSRFATDIAKTKIDNFKSRETELKTMGEMVNEATAILQSKEDPIEKIGKLLHDSWQFKRSLSTLVSSPEIDEIYKAGMDAGATGGKLLGAGGGGFMLFFVKPELQKKVRERLKHLVHVNFKFENEGSKVVLYNPNI